MDDSINIELHEREKRAVLRALFAIEQRDLASSRRLTMPTYEEIRRETGLTSEAVHRAVTTLEQEGLVEFDRTTSGGFGLTPAGRLFTIKFLYEEAMSWRERMRLRLKSPAMIAAVVSLAITVVGSLVTLLLTLLLSGRH